MNKITDMLTQKMSKFISSLKTDKKKLFLFVGVIVLLFVFIILGGRGKDNEIPGFGTQLGNIINSENYNGSGALAICNNEFDISINKNQDNAQMGIKNNDINYSGLVTKYKNAIYLNSGAFENKGDIISVRKCTPTTNEEDEEQVEVTLKSLLLDILNSEYLIYTEVENVYTATISNGENWSNFFKEAEDKLSENKLNILQYYTDAAPVKEEIENIISALKTIGASKNDANSMTFIISYDEETEVYTLSIDISLDFASLPSFIQEKDFDTNKFTIYCTINYTFDENTVNIPTGSVRNIGNDTINNFIVDCWNSIFERKTYVARNTVTEKADSVQNVISLGNTTETYQYLFDKDGVYKGTLIVTSNDENVIQQYFTKYSTGRENKAIFNSNTKMFTATIEITDTGINSLNKIATTPSELAAYLRTAEGVVPIV